MKNTALERWVDGKLIIKESKRMIMKIDGGHHRKQVEWQKWIRVWSSGRDRRDWKRDAISVWSWDSVPKFIHTQRLNADRWQECDTCKHMKSHAHITACILMKPSSCRRTTRGRQASRSFVKACLCHEKHSNPSRFLFYLKIMNGWPLKRRNGGCEDFFNCISCQKAKPRWKPAKISAVARLERLCLHPLSRGRLDCFCLLCFYFPFFSSPHSITDLQSLCTASLGVSSF